MLFRHPLRIPTTLVPTLAVCIAATNVHAAPSLVSAPAAEPATSRPDRSDEGAVIDRRGDTRVLIYEGDTLEGEVLSPGGAAISGHIGARHASLVGIRPHFVGELIRLSNDL